MNTFYFLDHGQETLFTAKSHVDIYKLIFGLYDSDGWVRCLSCLFHGKSMGVHGCSATLLYMIDRSWLWDSQLPWILPVSVITGTSMYFDSSAAISVLAASLWSIRHLLFILQSCDLSSICGAETELECLSPFLDFHCRHLIGFVHFHQVSQNSCYWQHALAEIYIFGPSMVWIRNQQWLTTYI